MSVNVSVQQWHWLERNNALCSRIASADAVARAQQAIVFLDERSF